MNVLHKTAIIWLEYYYQSCFGGDYMTDNKLKVFLVTRKAGWCEDDAIVVLAIVFLLTIPPTF